jgi:triosephosphate isomerase
MKMIIANWKMNGTLDAVSDFCRAINSNLEHTNELVLAFPDTFLQYASQLIDKSKATLCGQAISSEIEGAYTGQTSAKMLKDIGCTFTLVGHSERRAFETEIAIKNQISRAFEQNITPILCIGETLIEKKNKKTSESLIKQIEHCLTHNEKEKIIVAYEPKWAIGSGLTPSIDEIKIVVNLIRSHIGNKVLYGGSVNLENYSDILKSGVDGLLIGGLSLSSQKLIQIINGPQL